MAEFPVNTEEFVNFYIESQSYLDLLIAIDSIEFNEIINDINV